VCRLGVADADESRKIGNLNSGCMFRKRSRNPASSKILSGGRSPAGLTSGSADWIVSQYNPPTWAPLPGRRQLHAPTFQTGKAPLVCGNDFSHSVAPLPRYGKMVCAVSPDRLSADAEWEIQIENDPMRR